MPDYDSFEDEQEQEVDSGESNPMKQLRNQLKEEQKSRRALEREMKELQDLKTQVTAQQRVEATHEIMKQWDLPKSAAKFFVLENPEAEVTEEAIAQWGLDNDYLQEDESEAATETDSPQPENSFSPTPTSGAPPEGKLMTTEEWKQLAYRDRNAAMTALREGKVADHPGAYVLGEGTQPRS